MDEHNDSIDLSLDLRGIISWDNMEQAKQTLANWMNTIMSQFKGNDLLRYWKPVDELVKEVTRSMEQFSKLQTNVNAANLINAMNALKAVAGEDISGVMSNSAAALQEFDRAVSHLGTDTVNGLSVEAFRGIIGTMNELKEVGFDVDTLFRRIGTDSGLDAVNRQLATTKSELNEANAKLAQFESGVKFTELNEQLDTAHEKIRDLEFDLSFLKMQARSEFENFLTANEIDPDQTNASGDNIFQRYFDKIEEGTWTAREAITKFKAEFADLLNQNGGSASGGVFNTDQVDQFISKLDQIFNRVEEISAYIRNGGGGGGGTAAAAQQLDNVAQSAERSTNAVRELQNQGGGIGEVGSAIAGMASSSAESDAQVQKLSGDVVSLVDSLTKLGGVGDDALSSIASIFRNLDNVSRLSVVPEEFGKLKNALADLGSLKGLENLTYISGINLQGFNGLSVSKASLRNMADYLPVIARDTDIGKLEALSHISLANFNKENLTVSTASLEHLRELIAQISGQPLQVKNSNGQTQQLSDEQAALDRLNTAYNSHIDAVKRAVEEEQKKEEVAERLALKLQAEKEAMEGVSSSTKNASDAGAEYAGIWDKMFLGKFEAQLKKVQEQFSALQDKPEKLSRNMALLAEKEQKMREAGTMKEKLVAYKEFVLILDTVRDQIGAVSAEEKNLSTAAKDLLRIMNEVQKPVDALKNGSFANELQKLQIQAKGLSNADLTRNLNDMVTAMEAMKAAIGPNGTPQTEQDLYALARAYDQWKVAVQGVKSALGLVNTENAGMKRQEKEARDFEKTASDLEQRVDSLKKKLAELKTPGKIDSGSLQQIQQLLTTIRDTSADASTRTTAVSDLKALIDQLTVSYQSLADTEKADAEAAKLANQERNRSNAAAKQLSGTLTKAQAALEKYKSVQNMPGIKNTYEELQRVTSELQNYQSQISGSATVTPEMAARIQDLSARYVQLNQQLAQNNTFFGRWLTSGMGMLKSRLSYTFGLVNIVMKTVAEIKKMISTAVELDSAMNDLQIVTRASGAEMDEYAKRVSAMAKETAQATKDLIDATTVYARLGYNMDESSVLAKYTAMLQAVGDIEAGPAQDAMTAIVKAFNVDINDIEQVMDKMVVVGRMIAQGYGNVA